LNLTGSSQLTRWNSLKKEPRPQISLDVRRCSPDIWRQFRQYHYLNSELSPFAKNYVVLYKGKPIAFMAIMKVKMSALYYRVSRLVVLPDYQGIGIGKCFLNFMVQYCTSKTKLPFTIITSNPQLIRGNMESWKITHIGRGQRVDSRNLAHPYTGSSEKRITVSMRYSPEKGNFRG
jgi:GNAT superfamily N-acetyltransferase